MNSESPLLGGKHDMHSALTDFSQRVSGWKETAKEVVGGFRGWSFLFTRDAQAVPSLCGWWFESRAEACAAAKEWAERAGPPYRYAIVRLSAAIVNEVTWRRFSDGQAKLEKTEPLPVHWIFLADSDWSDWAPQA
jgi:hypothetical protein